MTSGGCPWYTYMPQRFNTSPCQSPSSPMVGINRGLPWHSSGCPGGVGRRSTEYRCKAVATILYPCEDLHDQQFAPLVTREQVMPVEDLRATHAGTHAGCPVDPVPPHCTRTSSTYMRSQLCIADLTECAGFCRIHPEGGSTVWARKVPRPLDSHK